MCYSEGSTQIPFLYQFAYSSSSPVEEEKNSWVAFENEVLFLVLFLFFVDEEDGVVITKAILPTKD